MAQPQRVTVLVEGRSDAAAVEVLAGRLGVAGLGVVDMAGVTNVRRELGRTRSAVVLGLCDAGEVRFVQRALAAHGREPADASDQTLATHGWFVCHRDLEEELIRAVGVAGCLQAIEDIGDTGRWQSFTQQPEWRERDPVDQLHRFAGTASGRKLAFATRLAQVVPAEQVPAPIERLLARVAEEAADP